MFNFLKTIRYAKRSPRWSEIRKQHLEQYPKCAACGRDKKIEVHHKVPVHIDGSMELDLSNLISLCADPCHMLFGHLMNFKSYNKTVEQDCRVYFNKVVNRP